MQEEWRSIPEFGGSYEVSNFGNVRSYRVIGKDERFLLREPRPMVAKLDRDGYLQIGLRKGPKRFWRKVHSLVLDTFVGPCPEGMEACHGDGDRANPRLDNLRWGTRADNIEDKRRHGVRMGAPTGDKHHRHPKLWPEAVRCIRAEPAGPGVVAMLAKAFGVSINQIRMVRGRRSWAHVEQQL